VAGYDVYRSEVSGGPYSKLDSSIVAADSYNDASVQAGLTYYYVVKSVTSAGVQSADSAQTSAAIPTP
jgi:fibronectin type 3 domain-containing protein